MIKATLEELHQKLQIDKFCTFRMESSTNSSFIFFNTRSLSVGFLSAEFSILKFSIFQPIQTKAWVNVVKENELQVNLITPIRYDLILLASISLVMVIIASYLKIFINVNVSPWSFPLIFPGIPIWFWMLYRNQEKVLQEKVERFIRLKTGNW